MKPSGEQVTRESLDAARQFVESQHIFLWESQEAYNTAVASLALLLDSREAQVRRDALEEAAQMMDGIGERLANSMPPEIVGALNCKQFAKAIRARAALEKESR
jgi:hypothetical protein